MRLEVFFQVFGNKLFPYSPWTRLRNFYDKNQNLVLDLNSLDVKEITPNYFVCIGFTFRGKYMH